MLQALAGEVRATPLDPARPALDLLEDLLSGIYGCALLFREYRADAELDDKSDEDALEQDVDALGDESGATDLEHVEDVVGLMLSQSGTADTSPDGEDEDGDWPQVGSQEFLTAVRAEAAEHATHLY